MRVQTQPAAATLAFIYDRHLTLDTTALELRLATCAQYADAQITA
ncbi:hypothetical protein [Streptomyces silvisoli]|uniref:Uncharacterized protein n=1 Tax=Streptomyces silvisoli TaxID=3034235 RepID=A0ABT5ZJR7_9ACTN|nr:hypothetical protein [Streptomyces silvisoli]MDF3289253.1 hypothetical protein [Streptomyces silvisoli]